ARTLRTYAWLSIWRRTFARFLGWRWVGITVVIVTGLVMASVVSGGSGELPAYIRAMMVSGMGAMAAFAYLYFMPWRLLNKAIWKSDLAAVEKRLRQIRLLVVMTMFLGLVTALVPAARSNWSYAKLAHIAYLAAWQMPAGVRWRESSTGFRRSASCRDVG